VETSSPYPLTNTSGHTAPSAREEGAEQSASDTTTDEAVAAAEHFLQELPHPWTAGRVTARKIAPLLAVAAADQGWELDDALVAQLTQNPEGVKRFPATLRARIEDLPRRVGRRQPVPPQRAEGRYSDLPTEPDFTPVPMPGKVADLLERLRKPAI
jgi:hypothetical protein